MLMALPLILYLAIACAGASPSPAPTIPDIGSTVQAAVAAALPTETPTPTPDIDATVEAGMAATIAAMPTPTATSTPTLAMTGFSLALADYPDIYLALSAGIIPQDILDEFAANNIQLPDDAELVAVFPGFEWTIENTPFKELRILAAAGEVVVEIRGGIPLATTTPVPTATLAPAPTGAPLHAEHVSPLVRRVRPAVVRLRHAAGVGSGVIFKTEGQEAYVLTNDHVVDRRRTTVTVNDQTEYVATILGQDRLRDLAVLRICCGRFTALALGSVADIEAGRQVLAMGYPLGFEGEATITIGIISAVRYNRMTETWDIQTDAALNPGNSGGPLLSMDGEILGINTRSIDHSNSGRPVEGLGFAVSVQTIYQHIERLSRRAAVVPIPTAVPTRVPTPTAIPTPTRVPAPTAVPTPTRVPTPTTIPTPTRVPVLGEDYFTRGSSQDDVLHVQGTPTKIETWFDEEWWYYGRLTRVIVSLPDRVVTGWDNYDGTLKVRLLPATSKPTTEGYFTRGSSQDDVLRVQGTPTKIETWFDEEWWYYGRLTRVIVSLPDRVVTA